MVNVEIVEWIHGPAVKPSEMILIMKLVDGVYVYSGNAFVDLGRRR